jgi:4-hydroxy-3-methylbut-2-enyl diphosphate reductase
MAELQGVPSYLINKEEEINPSWLQGVKIIGLTAGASTPEDVVQACISRLQELGVSEVEDALFVEENVVFQLPKQVLVSF